MIDLCAAKKQNKQTEKLKKSMQLFKGTRSNTP